MPKTSDAQEELASMRVDVQSDNHSCEENVLQDTGGEVALPYGQMRGALHPMLFDFLKSIDTTGRGVVASRDLEEAAEMFRTTNDAREHNAGQLRYRHLPDCVKQVLEKWDTDQNGWVSVEELQAASRSHEKQKRKTKQARWMVVVMFIAIVALAASTFVTALAAFEMAKELKTSSNGIILTKDGQPALIASADIEVQNGTLVARDGLPRSPDKMSIPLATRPSEVERSLSSTIPDKFLAELTKVAIGGADGVSHMTLHILGFTRVLAPSKCGSLVYLSSLLGTVTLDDTNLHFDDTLASRAAAVGMTLDSVSLHGRRLSSAAAVVGIFNFFEDYDWQCDSLQTPQSPAKPYIMNTLKRVPCPTLDHCTSFMGGNVMIPGYDEVTESVVVADKIVETDDFSLSIQRYPNHPSQMLVSITDHRKQTHKSMQVFNGTGYNCVPRNYSDAVGNASDTLHNYFPAFIGRETRPATEFNLPWGRMVIPQRSVRSFRLQPRTDADGVLPVPIDYDDDAETLLPTRLNFHGAKDLALDVQEILVESLQQNVLSAAEELRRSVDFDCASVTILDLPRITSPFTENGRQVAFYVQHGLEPEDMANKSGNHLLTDSYWMRALEWEQKGNHVDKSSGRSRLLLSDALERRLDAYVGFEVEIKDDAMFYGGIENGNCLAVGGEVKTSPSPWAFWGEVQVGSCGVRGQIGVKHGYEVDLKKEYNDGWFQATLEFKCGLFVFGYIGARSGYYYVGRRLESLQDQPNDNIVEANETAHDGDDELAEAKEETAQNRRLWWWDDRRRRSRQYKIGYEIIAGIGVEGGCSTEVEFQGQKREVGVALEGELDISLGPWPAPLDARAVGGISVKACVKIGPFSACVGFPVTELFNKDI